MRVLREDGTEVKRGDILKDNRGNEYEFCWLGDIPAPGHPRRIFVKEAGISSSLRPEFLKLTVE